MKRDAPAWPDRSRLLRGRRSAQVLFTYLQGLLRVTWIALEWNDRSKRCCKASVHRNFILGSYNVTGSRAAGGSFSTPFHPTGRPLTASFTERNNTMYIS